MDATEDIIAHQVNCKGVMGAGVAWCVKNRFPAAYRKYKALCEEYEGRDEELLGECQIVLCKKTDGTPAVIANLFAQHRYGWKGIHTDERAFAEALSELARKARRLKKKTIAMPYKIGCGLGGGNWDRIYKIIEKALDGFDVRLYKLEKRGDLNASSV